MATAINTYQCPACTGPLHFGAGSGKLECEYCGSSFEVAEIEAQYQEKDEKAAAAMESAKLQGQWDTSGLSDDWGGEGASIKAYNCPSCGAQLLCEEAHADLDLYWHFSLHQLLHEHLQLIHHVLQRFLQFSCLF